jgi:hypothetical protein
MFTHFTSICLFFDDVFLYIFNCFSSVFSSTTAGVVRNRKSNISHVYTASTWLVGFSRFDLRWACLFLEDQDICFLIWLVCFCFLRPASCSGLIWIFPIGWVCFPVCFCLVFSGYASSLLFWFDPNISVQMGLFSKLFFIWFFLVRQLPVPVWSGYFRSELMGLFSGLFFLAKHPAPVSSG